MPQGAAAGCGPFSCLMMFWSRIMGPSGGECERATASAHSVGPAARSKVAKRCMRFGKGKRGGWASVRLSANSISSLGRSGLLCDAGAGIEPLVCRLFKAATSPELPLFLGPQYRRTVPNSALATIAADGDGGARLRLWNLSNRLDSAWNLPLTLSMLSNIIPTRSDARL